MKERVETMLDMYESMCQIMIQKETKGEMSLAEYLDFMNKYREKTAVNLIEIIQKGE